MAFDDRMERAVTGLREGQLNPHAASEVLATVVDHVHEIPIKRHPLGFTHFDLTPITNTSDDRVRLHIWSRQSGRWADGLGKRHDHVWGLTSAVLVGALVDVLLEAVPDPAGNFSLAEVTYSNAGQTARSLPGSFRPREMSYRKVRAGDIYTLKERCFHETLVQTFPTATLVLAKPSIAARPRILTAIALGTEPQAVSNRTDLDPQEALADLAEALDACG